jgi:hypothetical protein
LALTDVNYGTLEVQLFEKLLDVVERAKYLAFVYSWVIDGELKDFRSCDVCWKEFLLLRI